MHVTLDELCEEGLLAVAVDGSLLVEDYPGLLRTLETFVTHAGEASRVLLVVSAMGAGELGEPWRNFDFVSAVLEGVESCAVVGEPVHREFLEHIAAASLTEAVVQFFPSEQRTAALDWLQA